MTAAEANALRVDEMRAGLDRGWAYVPCRGKVAETPLDVELDPEKLLAHAQRRNVAIVLGDRSGLCAIDASSAAGLPATWTIRTAHGVLCLYTVGRPAPASRARAGLRVLSRDAYAMAPGSVHPETGDVYAWQAGASPDDLPLAPLPAAILEALSAPEEPSPPRPPEPPPLDLTKDYPEVQVSTPDLPMAFTDLANARELVREHREDIRYCPGLGWLEWDGTRWRPDEDGAAARYAKRIADLRKLQADACGDADLRKRLLADAIRCEGARRILSTLTLAETESPLIVAHRQLDADPWALNTPSGTVDLRTGALRPHDRADLHTRRTLASYDADAECPRWVRFLLEVFAGDRELIWWVQKAIGYSATGLTNEQCFLLCHGTGANGKSTLLEVVREVLGEYAQDTPSETFMAAKQKGATNDLARLRAARFVTSSEAGEGRRFDEELIKRFTGGDTVTARFMYREFFEFRPVMTLWIAANHKPDVRGQDDGIWRRVRLVPFEVSFRGREEKDLPATLRAEAPGILRWIVEGAIGWAAQGLGDNQRVVAATAEYREDSDVFGQFLEECCEVGSVEYFFARSSDLYSVYQWWARQRGDRFLINQTRLAQRLKERGFEHHRDGRGKLWRGLSVRPEVAIQMDHATAPRSRYGE